MSLEIFFYIFVFLLLGVFFNISILLRVILDEIFSGFSKFFWDISDFVVIFEDVLLVDNDVILDKVLLVN